MYWDDWKSYLGQDMIFRKEMTSLYDCFAVVENIMLPGKICQETAGNECSKARQTENNYCNNGKIGKGKEACKY